MPRQPKYRHRIDSGLCASCGQQPPDNGYTRCGDCRSAAAKREAERRQKREAAGLCRSCGKNPPRDGSPDCPVCLERYAGYQRG